MMNNTTPTLEEKATNEQILAWLNGNGHTEIAHILLDKIRSVDLSKTDVATKI